MEAIGREDPERASASRKHGLAAYRRPTPQHWSDLLDTDLSVLLQLRRTVVELLEELPMLATGLGATEMRMLELVAAGNSTPFDIFPGHQKRNTRRVFDYREVGLLLDGLAGGPSPAVAGLEEGPFSDEMHADRNRRARYKQSKLSLTTLGHAVLEKSDDLSRHNPIHRWWGGTKLTNDNLWRWDPVSCLPAQRVVAHRFRQSCSRRQGRLQPAQSDRPLVGRDTFDER